MKRSQINVGAVLIYVLAALTSLGLLDLSNGSVAVVGVLIPVGVGYNQAFNNRETLSEHLDDAICRVYSKERDEYLHAGKPLLPVHISGHV